MAFSMRFLIVVQSTIIGFALAMNLIMAYGDIKNNELTIGDFMVFQIYTQQLI